MSLLPHLLQIVTNHRSEGVGHLACFHRRKTRTKILEYRNLPILIDNVVALVDNSILELRSGIVAGQHWAFLNHDPENITKMDLRRSDPQVPEFN